MKKRDATQVKNRHHLLWHLLLLLDEMQFDIEYSPIGCNCLLLCFIINIVTSFKNKTYILLVFLFVVFIRAMLDTLISYGPFDVVFYVLLLLITKKSHVV